jgi:hypothetical protein
MQTAHEIYARLGLGEPDEVTAASWPETMRDFPHPTPMLFDSAFVMECCAEIHIPSDIEQALQDAAAVCLRSADLNALGWHWHKRLGERKWIPTFAPIASKPDPCSKLFWALLFLAQAPRIREFFRERQISDAIALDTLSDLELWIRHHKRLTGKWGMDRPDWIANHFGGRIVKLGRLQFEQHAFGYEMYAYRHRATRRVLVFAGQDQFRADGQYQNSDGGLLPAAFSTTFSDDGTTIHGHPVLRGVVQAQAIDVKSSEWERIFGPGDPCLGIHIAATGPMDHETCGESMRQAGPFFLKHFPERPFKAFTCSSWLLDSQLEGALPADSNIVRFLSEFYLFPLPYGNSEQTYERVFDNHKIDIAAAPQKSTLQKAVVAHVKAGGRWRGGGGLYFPEDLAWGKQVYRKS